MNPALNSLGIITIFFGAATFAFAFESGHRPGPLMIAVCAALVLGGAALLMKRAWSFWAGLAAGAFTFVAGLVSLKLPSAGGGMQPIFPIVIGLYVCLRVAIAKHSLIPRRRREEEEDGDGGEERAE